MTKTGVVASNGNTKQIFETFEEGEIWLKSLTEFEYYSATFGVIGYIEEYSIIVDDKNDQISGYTVLRTYVSDGIKLPAKSDEDLKELYDSFCVIGI